MTHSNRWPMFAAATALVAAKLVVAPTPAQADPPACEQWGFGGNTQIVSNGRTVASFDANGPSFSGPAGAGDLTVPTSAVVHENNFIEISQSMPGPPPATQSYNGVVGPDGIAHGSSSNTSPIVASHPDWSTAAPLTCLKQAAQAQPAPVDQVRMKITTNLGRANVTITNLSTVAGTCAYQADDTAGLLPSVHRDVNLAAKGTATINDLLAPPLLSTYHVVLSCKGDFNGNQVEFGHVEQDVSSF